jgi:hypothetical protein
MSGYIIYPDIHPGVDRPYYNIAGGKKNNISCNFREKLFSLCGICTSQLDKTFDKKSQKYHQVSAMKTRKILQN